MARVHHRVGIAASPERVLRALVDPEDLLGWWAEFSHGKGEADNGKHLGISIRWTADQVGDSIAFLASRRIAPGVFPVKLLNARLKAASDW